MVILLIERRGSLNDKVKKKYDSRNLQENTQTHRAMDVSLSLLESGAKLAANVFSGRAVLEFEYSGSNILEDGIIAKISVVTIPRAS